MRPGTPPLRGGVQTPFIGRGSAADRSSLRSPLDFQGVSWRWFRGRASRGVVADRPRSWRGRGRGGAREVPGGGIEIETMSSAPGASRLWTTNRTGDPMQIHALSTSSSSSPRWNSEADPSSCSSRFLSIVRPRLRSHLIDFIGIFETSFIKICWYKNIGLFNEQVRLSKMEVIRDLSYLT